jgi:hypothetical protein
MQAAAPALSSRAACSSTPHCKRRAWSTFTLAPAPCAPAQLKTALPELMRDPALAPPPKHALHLGNQKELLDRRREELERWMWRLIGRPEIARSGVLKAFLEFDRALARAQQHQQQQQQQRCAPLGMRLCARHASVCLAAQRACCSSGGTPDTRGVPGRRFLPSQLQACGHCCVIPQYLAHQHAPHRDLAAPPPARTAALPRAARCGGPRCCHGCAQRRHAGERTLFRGRGLG